MQERALESVLEEAAGLARAIYLDVRDVQVVNVKKPAAGYLFGKGHREAIAAYVDQHKPDLVIVNHTLSPVQQRNLERAWRVKVIDRTGLILEIFGERAETKEGKIQVELAALEYQRSRLVRSWTHLERQRGGAGFMGGPGETQIEIDRRLIGERITRLKKDLEQVRKTRDLQRRSRERVPFPIIALVGYTNAGKSTLFNRVTGASVYAEDLPFATLDPTMRKISLESGIDVILSDTVGFIADLPTNLVAAFRATLEQLQYAEIILHVRDMARPDREAQKEDVIETLAGLDIHYEQDDRILEVWNKSDSLPSDDRDELLRKAKFADTPPACVISALTGEGIDELFEILDRRLAASRHTVRYVLPAGDGKALAWLHNHAHVLAKKTQEAHIEVEVEISSADLGRFHDMFDYTPVSEREDEDGLAYGS